MIWLRAAFLLVSIIALAACGGDESPGEDAPAVIGTLAPNPTQWPSVTPTPTPGPSTATPRPALTRTPVPTATSTPIPTLDPTTLLPTLAETEYAILWIYVWDDERGRAEVSVGWKVDFLVDAYDFDVHLQAGIKSENYCNTSAVFPDEVSTTFGCGRFEVSHQNITGVRASVLDTHFRCERNETSANRSVFACEVR